jgi:hypothetical protein
VGRIKAAVGKVPEGRAADKVRADKVRAGKGAAVKDRIRAADRIAAA